MWPEDVDVRSACSVLADMAELCTEEERRETVFGSAATRPRALQCFKEKSFRHWDYVDTEDCIGARDVVKRSSKALRTPVELLKETLSIFRRT